MLNHKLAQQLGSHRDQHLFVFGEAEPAFLGYYFIANPDCEFSSIARNQFGVDRELFLEQVRHTGGPWQVVSNYTVAYGNRLHCGNLLGLPDYIGDAGNSLKNLVPAPHIEGELSNNVSGAGAGGINVYFTRQRHS
jgi:hypothetical protein